jgi:hypothetical protein
MHRLTASSTVLAASLLAAASTSLVAADVTVSSPDGRWVATIEDIGGGAGQVTSMKDMSLRANEQSFVANTVHFVRVGTNLSYPISETQRMENLFTCVRFFAEGDNFTAVLAANNLSGTVAMVNGEMVSGPQGGLRVAISFMDAAPAATQLLQTTLKPFVYANMNVDGGMSSNIGNWVGGAPNGHFWQKRNGSVSNSERWFVGAGVDGVQAMSDSFMLSYLDDGATSLSNQVLTGPADLNCAMSWPAATIDQQSYTVEYGLGNVNLFVSPDFGTVPVDNLFIRSGDTRWLSQVAYSSGVTASLKGLVDQINPAGFPHVAFEQSPYAFVGTASTPNASYLPNTVTLLQHWIPGSSRRSTQIHIHPSHPGLVYLFDAMMLDGEAGGAAVSMTWVDTAGQHPFVTPVLYADMDVDNVLQNVGGFENDHFWMTAPSTGSGNVRWIRPTFYDSYMMGSLGAVTSLFLNNTSLPNTTTDAIADLEWAVRYPGMQLQTNVPFVYGYVIGNPNVTMPATFCQPTFDFPCPADLTGDGVVDAADLSILLGNWGPWQPTSPDTDFNDDSMTDAADLSILLGGWGSCG